MHGLIAQMVCEYEHGRLSRRELIGSLTMLGAAMATGAPALGQAQTRPGTTQPGEQPTFAATGLNHIALSVTDVARSRDFYMRHLGLTLRSNAGDSSCFLNAGPHFVALFRGEPRMHHYCYSVPQYTAQSAVEKLTAAGLKPERQGGRVYFPDPDGLIVQVAAGERQRENPS